MGPLWRGVKLVLQQARHSAVPLMPTVPSMDNVWQSAKKANNNAEPFDPATADYATKAVTLYRMIIPKLNFYLSTELRNSAPDSGFALWRLSNRKLGSQRADVEFHFINDIRKHARKSCASFEQTVRFITFLDREAIFEEVLGAAMDEDTVGRMEDAGKSIKDYTECKMFCENRFMRMQSRIAGKTLPKYSDKMVYGVDMSAPSAGPPPAQPAPEPAAAAGPEPPGVGVDPWATQDPWGCHPCAPDAQAAENQWHLDHFGQKGGEGKKGERPPMACYNCLGLGHPKVLCPSPCGAGEQKATPKCKNCSGFGHDTPTCTSRGGAKYTPPPAFGKGKGKGKDSKGWQDRGKGTGGSQWGKGAWGKRKRQSFCI